MRRKSKLVESLGIKTEREFDRAMFAANVTPIWKEIFHAVIMDGSPYQKAGAIHGKTKHAVYEKLCWLRGKICHR